MDSIYLIQDIGNAMLPFALIIAILVLVWTECYVPDYTRRTRRRPRRAAMQHMGRRPNRR